jgi:hypothetical protein
VEPSLDTIAMADSTTLFEIQFTYTGDSSALPFNLAEFTDINFSMVPTTTLHGAVRQTPSLTGPVSVCKNSTGNVYTTEAGKSNYAWTVTGGTITAGGSGTDNTVTVTWPNAGNRSVKVKYTGGTTTTLPVVVHELPIPEISGPEYVYSYQTGASYCTPEFTDHSYDWTVINGTIAGGQGTHCITVDWGSYPSCGCGKVIVLETNTLTGCIRYDTLNIVIQAANLFGQVTYNNQYETPLNGVTVTLRNTATGQWVADATSGVGPGGVPGYYSFNNIPNGTYRIRAAYNGPWGGNNATDALAIQLNVIGSYPLFYLRDSVADVNGSWTKTALDALYVKLRTIGMITSYPAGDWEFTDTTVTITSAATINLKGLCVGDVNASYIPNGFKEASLVGALHGDTLNIAANQPFVYQIRTQTDAEAGAFTLFMEYDESRFTIDSIAMISSEMRYKVDNGTLAIAWSDPDGLIYRSGDPLVTLTMRAKQTIDKPSGIFNLLPGSEVAGRDAVRYDHFDLKFDQVITGGTAAGFSMSNFPNPFSNKTHIVYTLPAEGHVLLELTDVYGRLIGTLVNEDKTANQHQFTLDAADYNLVNGVYFCRLTAETNQGKWTKSVKMILAK